MSSLHADPPRLRLDPTSYERLRQQVCVAIGGNVKRAAGCRILKFTTNGFGVSPAMMPTTTLLHFVLHATQRRICSMANVQMQELWDYGLWQNSPRWQIMVG